jgi:hypothetical protein
LVPLKPTDEALEEGRNTKETTHVELGHWDYSNWNRDHGKK